MFSLFAKREKKKISHDKKNKGIVELKNELSQCDLDIQKATDKHLKMQQACLFLIHTELKLPTVLIIMIHEYACEEESDVQQELNKKRQTIQQELINIRERPRLAR